MGKIIRALALGEQVKVCYVNSTDIVSEAIKRHDLWPSAASVLGKAMTISLMMASSLKGQEALTIKIDGNGPIGQVICDATSHNTVRGYVSNPHVNFTKGHSLDDITTLGYNGYIDVIKDLKMNDLHTSSVAIQTGNLAHDFAYYYNVSEQIPTAILLGSLFEVDNTCSACGGLLIQSLPKANLESIALLEERISQVTHFSQMIHNSIDEILNILFDGDYQILSVKEAMFHCPCSKERFMGGLSTLTIDDLNDMITKENGAHVICHYCNHEYHYSASDLEKIKTQKEKK